MQSMMEYEYGLWSGGIEWIAGIDEAGRGPLAGPVVAAAVVFPRNVFVEGVDDSKKIPARRREVLHDLIHLHAAAVGVGIVDEKEIDRINILQATYQAMRMAVQNLSISPHHLLVDGRPIPDSAIPQTAVVKGDQKSFFIAAASIVAKVTRDRIMVEYDKRFPQYGFARHKGYGTKSHVSAIRQYGICDLHRQSFHVPEW